MIEVRDLAKTYTDGTCALLGMDLTLETGMFGLLGPNGAGKTTFLSILTLGQEPSRGSRTYFGLDDNGPNRARIRAMVGYLPQEFEPIGMLSGREYLLYCAGIRQLPLGRKAIRRRVESLLDAVELSAAGNRKSGGYSGGMKRRLGFAQAILHSPRFLVVDEPTAGLDPEERIRFRNLITSVADEIPVLLSTHIVEDIEATCPRVGILSGGALVFDGSPSQILEEAKGALWHISARSALPLDARKLRDRIDDQGREGFLVHSLDAPPSARPVNPTLEDAYAVFLAKDTQEREVIRR